MENELFNPEYRESLVAVYKGYHIRIDRAHVLNRTHEPCDGYVVCVIGTDGSMVDGGGARDLESAKQMVQTIVEGDIIDNMPDEAFKKERGHHLY